MVIALDIFSVHWPLMATLTLMGWLAPFGLHLPSPAGLTSLQQYALHGQVQTMHGEEATFKHGVESPQVLIGTAAFDLHGNATEEVQYFHEENPPVELHNTIINEYDAQGYLQKQEKRIEMQPMNLHAMVSTTFLYDFHDRLSHAYSSISVEDAASHGNKTLAMTHTYTFDEQGRVTKEAWQSDGEKDHSGNKTINFFTHHPNGTEGRIVESKSSVQSWTWYNARGDAVESRLYDSNGELSCKSFLLFTPDGAVCRGTSLNKNNTAPTSCGGHRTADADTWEKTCYRDYHYDTHGNWTRRVRCEVAEQGGKEVFIPVKAEYRSFSYYP